MYPNLNAEIARRNVTKSAIANMLDISYSTMAYKLRGATDFTLNEAIKIKKFLGVEMPIEELFEEAKV